MTDRTNIAARAGRWSAAHRKTAIFGWLAFVLVAFAVGGALGTKTIDQYHGGTGESGHADELLGEKFHQPATERVLVQSRNAGAQGAEFRAGVRDVSARMSAHESVTKVRKPALSDDGRSALVEFQVKGDSDQAQKRIDSILATTSAAQRAHPSLRIEQMGDASAEKAFEESLADDFSKAERLSLPITLVILVVAFGALAAAGIPVLLALTGSAGHARCDRRREPGGSRWTSRSARWCCWSAWPWESTTRCSTSGASVRSGRRAAAPRPRCRSPPPRPVARCWSPGSRSCPRWPACT